MLEGKLAMDMNNDMASTPLPASFFADPQYTDCLNVVLNYLEPTDLASLSQVCRNVHTQMEEGFNKNQAGSVYKWGLIKRIYSTDIEMLALLERIVPRHDIEYMNPLLLTYGGWIIGGFVSAIKEYKGPKTVATMMGLGIATSLPPILTAVYRCHLTDKWKALCTQRNAWRNEQLRLKEPEMSPALASLRTQVSSLERQTLGLVVETSPIFSLSRTLRFVALT